jgi:thiamine transport system substrate-binding protein
MLDTEFQADVPGQMFVHPVLPGVGLPEEFTLYAQVPPEPAALRSEDIALNREKWIDAWTEVVLR